MNETLLVEACEGRTVPIHADDNPEGGFVILKPGESMKVTSSTTIRRCLRDGDLVEVKVKAEKSTTMKPAPTAASDK